MNNNVKIGVGVELDDGEFNRRAKAIEKQFNSFGQAAAKASRQKFEPISIKTVQQLKEFESRYNSVLEIHTELARRLKVTGQEGLGPIGADYSRMFTSKYARSQKMLEVATALGGNFSGGSSGPSFSKIGTNIAQSGLRATGGVGGVAANALGTGVAAAEGGGAGAGFKAGLAGLLGGALALGVGKAIGAVTENMGRAEKHDITMDTLKRTLGDVNVSFNSLKKAVESSADSLGITFEEADKLAAQFSKLGNLSGAKYKELSGEMSTSVGMARSFGLDPSQTTNVLGQMRGIGVTRNEQETRRFALLIGETIGKSGAFAKADEVMESIGNYAAMQTRSSMGGANVSGYAGLFSGMVGSGIPGMDPTGAASILSRVNSALSAGGAQGEASQFATAIVGKQMGLSPIQTQVLREGGAFATNSGMFGKGSAYARYMGHTGPSGSTTFYEGTKRFVEAQYAGNSDDEKLLRALAFANHTGLNINQAMAMMSISAKSMGSLSRFGNVGDFNASGISGIATAMEGTAEDRQKLARDLLGRTGKGSLSSEDARALRGAMGTDNGDLKELLAKLSAKYGQEETTGSALRDSKTLLDNIKVSLADQLVPYTKDIREGILKLAGIEKKSPEEVKKDAAEASIREAYQKRIDAVPEAASIFDVGSRHKQIKAIEAERDAEINRMRVGPREQSGKIKRADGGEITGAPDGGSSALFDAMIKQESGGKHTDAAGNLLTSSRGARGITQIMPETGRNPGFGIAPLQNNSEAEYRRVGSQYLGAMMRRYHGDRARAAAAYNAGPGRVDAAIKKYGSNWLSALPEETQNYVSVLGMAGGTPMPEDAAMAAKRAGDNQMTVRGGFEPLRIVHEKPDGSQFAPDQYLNPRFNRPNASGKLAQVAPFGNY